MVTAAMKYDVSHWFCQVKMENVCSRQQENVDGNSYDFIMVCLIVSILVNLNVNSWERI